MSRSITYEEAKKRLEDRRELAEAYLRTRIEVRSESNNGNNNNTDLDRLERIAMLLNEASSTFNQAVNANGSKRRELLEEAFKAYAEIVPYLTNVTPYLTNTVLKQIKNVEELIELEIERNLDIKTDTIDVDSIMKEARESFL